MHWFAKAWGAVRVRVLEGRACVMMPWCRHSITFDAQSAAPVQTWHGVSAVLVQMVAGMRAVPVQLWAGGVSAVPVQMWQE